MRTRTMIRLAALSGGVLFLAALVVGLVALPASGSGDAGHHGAHNVKPERFLYVSTIAQSDSDPDFIAVIGADPRAARLRRDRQPCRHAQRRRRASPLRLLRRPATPDRARVVLQPDPRLRHRERRLGDESQLSERGPRHRQRVRRSPRRDGDARHAPGADDRGGQRRTQPGGIVEIDDRSGEFSTTSVPGRNGIRAIPDPPTCTTSR